MPYFYALGLIIKIPASHLRVTQSPLHPQTILSFTNMSITGMSITGVWISLLLRPN